MLDAAVKHTQGLHFKGNFYVFEMIKFGITPQTKLAFMALLKKNNNNNNNNKNKKKKRKKGRKKPLVNTIA